MVYKVFKAYCFTMVSNLGYFWGNCLDLALFIKKTVPDTNANVLRESEVYSKKILKKSLIIKCQ